MLEMDDVAAVAAVAPATSTAAANAIEICFFIVAIS
jgi:hypothetical protein